MSGDHPNALPPPTMVELTDSAVATYVLNPAGESAGDIVLCHGTPWSARVWEPAALELARTHRVLLFDMPGYGASPMDPTVPVDLVHQMARLAELLDRWGLDRPHVVAHDIGGAVAVGAHLHHGVDYRSLALLDVVLLSPWGSPFFRLVADHEDVFARLPARLHAALVTEYIAGAAAQTLPTPVLHALREPWTTDAGQLAFYRQIAQLTARDTEPLVERLGGLRCPVHVIWGESDPWIPVAQAADLVQRIPHATGPEVLASTGHLGPLEATDRLTAALLRWVTPGHSP